MIKINSFIKSTCFPKNYFDYLIGFVDPAHYSDILNTYLLEPEILSTLADLGCYINLETFIKNIYIIPIDSFMVYKDKGLITDELRIVLIEYIQEKLDNPNPVIENYNNYFNSKDMQKRLSMFIEFLNQ